MSGGAATTIQHIRHLDLRFNDRPWPFAEQHRAEIESYFAALKSERPSVWNGRVLLMHSHRLSGDTFHGEFLETDFASFTAWRAWGRPGTAIDDCFAAAAILSADGACLLGVMAPHTANAGKVYFPSGTPDPNDVIEGVVDFDASLQRELQEETGLGCEAFDPEPGWVMVRGHGLVAMIKLLHSPDTAEALRLRILGNLAAEPQPELSDIHIVRSPADFDDTMPGFVQEFLRYYWLR